MHNTQIMFSRGNNEWSTPQDFYDKINTEFNFTLDPCSTLENHKCSKYYTEDDDGLSKSWKGETVFCNPPFGQLPSWAEKCLNESMDNSTTIVMLIPARTDTKWFHKYICNQPNVEIRFVDKRLRFGVSKQPAPFPCLLVIFNGKNTKQTGV